MNSQESNPNFQYYRGIYNAGFFSLTKFNRLQSCTQSDGLCMGFFISMHSPSDWVQFGPKDFFCYLDLKKLHLQYDWYKGADSILKPSQ